MHPGVFGTGGEGGGGRGGGGGGGQGGNWDKEARCKIGFCWCTVQIGNYVTI